MKKIIFCLLLGLWTLLPAIAKNPILTNPPKDSLIKNLQIKMKAQEDSFVFFKKEFYELKKEKGYQTEKLEQTIDIAKTTIESQDCLINGFHVIYVVITLLVAIFLPVVVWYFSIRLPRKAINEFHKKTEEIFKDYTKRKKEEEITEYIILFESVTGLHERIVMDYLIMLSYEELNFDQCYKLSNIISNKIITSENKDYIGKVIRNLILRNSD